MNPINKTFSESMENNVDATTSVALDPEEFVFDATSDFNKMYNRHIDESTKDVLILIIEDHGEFNRNMTPAEWRRASLPEKYLRATANKYRVGGFELYRRVTYTEDSNFQVTVTDAVDAVRVYCDAKDLKQRLREVTQSPSLYVTLVNAVIAKDFDGPSYSAVLCNGIRLDDRVSKLVGQVEPIRPPMNVAGISTRVPVRVCPNCMLEYRDCRCGDAAMIEEHLDLVRAEELSNLLVENEALRREREVLRTCQCGAHLHHPATRVAVHDTASQTHEERRRFDWLSHKDLMYEMTERARVEGYTKDMLETLSNMMRMIAHREAIESFRLPGKRPEMPFYPIDRKEMEPQSTRIAKMFGLNQEKIDDVMDEATVSFTKVSDAAEDFVATSSSFRDSIPEITATINSVGDTARSFTSLADKTAEKIDSFSSKIDGLYAKLEGFVGGGYTEVLTELTSIVADCWSGAYSKETKGGFIRLLFRIFNMFKVSTTVVQLFLSTFKSSIQWIGRFISSEPNTDGSVREIGEAQAGGVQSLATLTAALVGTVMTGTIPGKEGMTYVTNLLRTFNYAVPAAGNIGAIFNYIVDMLPVCVRRWFCWLCPSEKIFIELGVDGECKKWLQEVDEVTADLQALLLDNQMQDRVIILDGVGKKLVMELAITVAKEHPDSKLFSLLNRYLTRIEKAKKLVVTLRGASGKRVTPFCVYLYGSPGVGKSSFARFLVDAVCPEEIPKENRIYARNSAAGFWDGYKRQFSVVCDDFHQSIEAKDVDEFIQVVSNNTFFPEFATLDNEAVGVKGTAMNSKLIVLLSNESHPDTSTAIRNSEAFLRRRHMVVKMVPKREFAVNQMEADPLKWRLKDEHRDAINWGHVDFFLMDPLRQNATTIKLTVKEMLNMFIDNYEKHMAREETMLLATESANVVDEVRAERKQRKEMRPEMFRAKMASAKEETLRLGQEMSRELFDHTQPGVKGGATLVSSLLTDLMDKADEVESPASFLARKGVFVTQKVVRTHGSPFDETIWGTAVREVEQAKEHWLANYPKVKFMLLIGGLAGVIGGAIYYFFFSEHSKKEYKAESSPERVKFKRGLALKRRFVAESAKVIPVANRWVLKLGEIYPDQDMRPLADKLELCRENAETYNAALAAGEIPEKEWVERMELAFEDMHRALHEVVPQWPVLALDMTGVKVPIVKGFEAEAARALGGKNEYHKHICDACGEPYEHKHWFKNENHGQFDKQCPNKKCKAYGVDHTASRSLVKDIGVAEGCADPQALSLENAVFLPAMVRIADEQGIIVGGLMVKGSVGLFPRHFFSTFVRESKEEGAKFTITLADGSLAKHVRFDKNRYVPLTSVSGKLKDVCLYYFGAEIRAYKDIVDHFVSERDIEKYTHFAGDLITFPPTSKFPVTKYCSTIRPLSYSEGHYRDHEGEDYWMLEGWEYNIPTAPGDCGAALVVHSSGLRRKLVGIHVSGAPSSAEGFSELVTSEQIERAMKKFPMVVVGQPIPNGLESVMFARPRELVVQSSTLTVLGTVPSEVCPRGAEKTQILRSPLHDQVFAHCKEPSALTVDDSRISDEFRGQSMLARGVLAFGRSLPAPRLDYAKKAIAYVSNKIRSVMRNEPRFICTEKEVINGKQEFTHCGSMEMATSPGYPYVLERPAGCKGKSYLFDGEEGERVVANALLRKNLDDREEKSKRLERPLSFWQAQLKDELRPMEKIAIGKTRVFVASNVDMTMMSRKYMLAFTSAMFRNCNDKGFFYAPGMDVFSYDWTVMMNGLRSVSKYGCAGDFGKYDTSLHAMFIDAVCDVMNDWFDDDLRFVDSQENKNVRKTLFHEYIHTMMLVGNTVCYKHGGNPSGNALTTIINTCVNEMASAYVYLEVAPDDQKDLTFYDANVQNKSYGDDIITAIKRGILEWYNMITISKGFETIGMEYTDPAKTGAELVAVRELEELTFLKCGFRKVGKLWFPTLSKESIQELTNWVSNTGDEWTLCLESCSDALKYAFFHGGEYFNEVRTKIERAAMAHGRHFVLPDEEYYAVQFAKRGKMPSLAYHSCGTVSVYEEYTLGTRSVMEMVVQSGRANPEPHLLGESSPEEKVVASDSIGIVMVEQAETIEVGRVGESSVDVAAMAAMKDFQWTVSQLVERSTLVTTADWTTSNPQGVALQVYSVPGDLIVDNTVTHTPFALYADWRGDVEVQISITGTKFVTGRLIAFFVPLSYVADVSDRFYSNLAAQTSVPHVFLDPADDTTAIIRIPFVNQKNFIKLREPGTFDILGTLVIMPLNILRVGAGAPVAVSYSVNVKFINNTFANPVPTEITRTFMTESKAVARRRWLEDQLDNLNKRFGKTVKEMEPQGASYSYFTNNNNLKNSTMKCVGDQKATSELSQTADVSIPTLDYPNLNLAPTPFVRSAMGNFSNTCQVDHNERLSLQPGASLTLAGPETFGTTMDEMSFDWLKKVQNISKIFQWSTINGAGSLLYSAYMCPLSDSLSGSWRLNTVFYPTTLDWMTMKFSFWQGDLKVRLQLIASQYHTGKLFVSLMYGVASESVSAMTLEQVTAGRGIYISLNDLQHDFEIDLDYNTVTDVLRVPHGPDGGNELEYCLGTWSIWVVEPLRAAPGVPTVVDVNVWKYAGDSYQVHHLGLNNATIMTYEGFVLRKETKEMEVQSGSAVSAAPAKARPHNPFGEEIRHIGDVIKRRVMVATLDNDTMAYGNCCMLDIGKLLFAQPLDPTNPDMSFYYPGSGIMRWFGAGYRAWRGSTRFRVSFEPFTNFYDGGMDYAVHAPVAGITVGWDVYSNNSTDYGAPTSFEKVFDNLDVGETSALGNYLAVAPPITRSEPGANYVSVEVPFVSLYKFLILVADTPLEGESSFNSPGSLLVKLPDPVDVASPSGTRILVSPGRAKVWASAGDELRFGIFLGPPSCWVGLSRVANDTYLS